MSGWLPPPPPPPVPSYPPGEYEGGSALYDALSQFFLVMILVGCQHPQLLIDPIVGLLRCLGGILSRCLGFIFDCVYEVNDRFEIFSSSPESDGSDGSDGSDDSDHEHGSRSRRRHYSELAESDDDEENGRGGACAPTGRDGVAASASAGERRRRGQRSHRCDSTVRLPPRGALRSAAGPFPGRVVLHHKLSRFQARLDEALRARQEAPRPPVPAAAPEEPRLADAAEPTRGSVGGDVERSRRYLAAARAAAEETEVRTETELNRELSPDVTEAVAEAGAAVHDAPHAQPDHGASAVHSEAGQGASTSVRQLEQQGREQQQGQDREGQPPQQQAERQQQRGSGAGEDAGAS